MKDEYRRLSDSSFKKFKVGGTCEAFTKLVLNHPNELVLCFRGNSNNKAVVYYNNHIVFSISAEGSVSISFDHARYCENWVKYKEDLENKYQFSMGELRLHAKRSEGSAPTYTIGHAKRASQKTPLTEEDVNCLYEKMVKVMMDSYFSAKAHHAYDRFYSCKNPSAPRRYASKNYGEKKSQQALFLAFKSLDDGYFFYDMEYAEPNGKEKNCKNQPDMLAIRFEHGMPKALVFVEVKSSRSALDGKSGLGEHIKGMAEYPLINDGLSLQTRREDARLILNQYYDLGLYSIPHKYNPSEFQALPFEMMVIFTDDVKEYNLSSVSRGFTYSEVPVPPSVQSLARAYHIQENSSPTLLAQ